ncbi:SprT family zinc-dependent metalloprotease [Aestuariibacter halophilus]|uniref:SprT family zinc-dependent metalloprotease n=1 Tax=Fluctibacter halophilus TaxID=226011 RepID=A0ABS8G4H7_9ALTE|nr:SprT family zinc-dependent metalloprotease [Aestuariibacter halophilus]MCC2615409.1 SprT family zinc-dependent metalloprotease [Aestuariibacter halophilus]
MTQTLQLRAQRRLNKCIAEAQTQLPFSIDVPTLLFNQRGKIAGSAHLSRNEIRLNPILLADNIEAFEHTVIPHELCHILVYQQHGRVKPHGKEWQTLMRGLFGLPPKVTHGFDTRRVEGRTFLYQCACGPVRLTVRRHNKVARNQLRYVCKTCGDALTRQN